jgi:hypothetical protein
MGEGKARGVLADIFNDGAKQQRQLSPADCTEVWASRLKSGDRPLKPSAHRPG